jgi:tetratricopeptide (TPR) repeat protein
MELSIHFTSDVKDETSPISVRLFRPDSGAWTEPAPFEPPLGDRALADLRWYLESFIQWPTGADYARAEGIKARLAGWGRDLLEAVTADRDAALLWQQFCDAEAPSGGKLVTIDAIEPRVLRLPWELLADEAGHLFARGIGVRRRLKKVTGRPVPPFELPVRVLVVVSRPEGAGFIDPRNVSRPLLDALEDVGERVVTEFLYPPTLEALDRRLRAATGPAPTAPPVHVVHFDGHGVYDVRQGLGYLLFEDEKHKENLVDAEQLGTLLSGCGVPLMVLNACQSAAQAEANPYASVAARLIQAGVGNVLAMNYSVLVVAARKFVESFYGGLAAGLSVGRAVDEGRRRLLADEKRHTLTRRDDAGDPVEETVRLRDWFLPALYQQAADPVVFAPEADLGGRQKTSEVLALHDPTAPGGLPAEPRHGFHGRAREMLKLERALAEKAVVVVHGFGGLGKTALAAEAGRWFHRTGRFPGGAAFVSFEQGGSLAQLCSWVGQAVSGDADFMVHGEGDPVARVGALLRARPALVILDNFESVLGREPLMPAGELQAVLDAVWAWAGGGTGKGGRGPGGSRVLITTRDTTFADARFKPSRPCAHVALEGLTRADALALAAAVLDDYGIDRAAIDRGLLEALIDHLGGHPLSLNLVLPHLRQYGPAELAARFEALLPGFTSGAAVKRNESLEVSLAFSLGRLGDETRAALPALAVFQGGCLESELLEITEIEPGLWAAARAEMEAAALVVVEAVPGVTPPFLRFHPTLLPYLARDLPTERRAELEARYWQRYYGLANYLYQADTQTPHQARAIAVRELPNLRRALDLCVEAASGATHLRGALHPDELVEAAADFSVRIARFLDVFGRWREREAMMERVGRLGIGKLGDGAGLSRAEYLLLSRQGEALWQAGRAAEAEGVFRELLARLEAGAAYEAAYDHAMTLWRMGRCLEAQGQRAQAVEWHRRALAEFEGLSGSSENARQMISSVYPDLGDTLAAIGQFDEARRAYESGLRVAREVDNQRNVGVTLGQLGNLALSRGDLGEATRRNREALDTFRALGEPQSEAVAWHQLGMVAEENRDWEEAERCYREAVRIHEQIGDLPMLATDFNQLAIVAKGAGRPADAERWYLRALEEFEGTGQLQYAAAASNNLADLYLGQGRLDEAEGYARRALGIVESLGDPSLEIWKDYALQARIAEARGRVAEAAQWRRKEQESYAAYAGAAHEIRQYQPLIAAVVRAAQGDTEAQGFVEGEYPKMEAGGEQWHLASDAIRRIVAGERDLDALTANVSSRTIALIVRTILTRLAGWPGATHPEGAVHREEVPAEEEPEGMSVGDLVGLVARAIGPDAPAGLGEELHGLTRGLAHDPGMPAEVRALGRVLHRILSGERAPDLSALPAEWAEAVRRLLAA